MEKEKPPEAHDRPQEAINNDNIVNIVNKCLDDAPDIPSSLNGCITLFDNSIICRELCNVRQICEHSVGGNL